MQRSLVPVVYFSGFGQLFTFCGGQRPPIEGFASVVVFAFGLGGPKDAVARVRLEPEVSVFSGGGFGF